MSFSSDWVLENLLKVLRHNLTPLFNHSCWPRVLWKMVEKVSRSYPRERWTKTWKSFCPNLSSFNDLCGAVRLNFPKWGILKVTIWGRNTTRIKKISTTMLVISILSDNLCLHQGIMENTNGRAIFVIVMIERWTSFYRIHDRQNVLASNIS